MSALTATSGRSISDIIDLPAGLGTRLLLLDYLGNAVGRGIPGLSMLHNSCQLR